jgi:hypothetical protein
LKALIYGILTGNPDVIISEVISSHLQTPEEAEKRMGVIIYVFVKECRMEKCAVEDAITRPTPTHTSPTQGT